MTAALLVLALFLGASCSGGKPPPDYRAAADNLAQLTATAYAEHLDELQGLEVSSLVGPAKVSWDLAPCTPSEQRCDALKAAKDAAFSATGCQTFAVVEITFVGEDPDVVFDFVATTTADAYNVDPDFVPAAVGYGSVRVPPDIVKRVPLLTADGTFVDLDRVFAIATLRGCSS